MTCAAGEKRKKLAVLFAEQKLSNRKIAKALNASKDTINRDLGANEPPAEKNLSQNNRVKPETGANEPPALLEGERAAKLMSKSRTTKVVEVKQNLSNFERFIAATCPTLAPSASGRRNGSRRFSMADSAKAFAASLEASSPGKAQGGRKGTSTGALSDVGRPRWRFRRAA